MNKNQKKGLLFIIIPIISLFVIIILFAVFSFLFAQSDSGAQAGSYIFINIILGLLGLISVLGIIIGIIAGIYYLAKKEDQEIIAKLKKEKEFKGLTNKQLVYLGSWSWGAFFGTWIWLLGNKLYAWAIPFIAAFVLGILSNLIFFINVDPMVLFMISSVFSAVVLMPLGIANLILWIYLSIKGRQFAWKKGWDNFEQFKQRQKQMIWIIIVGLILSLIISGLFQYIIMSQVQPSLNQFDQYETKDDFEFNYEQDCIDQCFEVPEQDFEQCLQNCYIN